MSDQAPEETFSYDHLSSEERNEDNSSDYENPWISSKNDEAQVVISHDSGKILERITRTGGSDILKANPLATNHLKSRRSRNHSNETGNGEFEKMKRELSAGNGEIDLNEIHTLLVEKSRSGSNFFDGIRNLRLGNEDARLKVPHPQRSEVYSKEIVQELSGIYPQLKDPKEAQFVIQFNLTGQKQCPMDRSGLDYFSKLHKSWGLISRASMQPTPTTAVEPIDLFHRFSSQDNESFTQLYTVPSELDLRCRLLDKYPKRVIAFHDKHSHSLKTSPESDFLIHHFKNFVKSHDLNCNRLHTLSTPSTSGIIEETQTDATRLSHKFQKKKFKIFFRKKKKIFSMQMVKKVNTSLEEEEFRWDSQLTSTAVEIRRPDLHDFYQSHDRNVLAFQALLDDPLKSISTPVLTLDMKSYSKILETDLLLHTATQVVETVEIELVELIETCRRMYLQDDIYDGHDDQPPLPYLRCQYLLLAEYDDETVSGDNGNGDNSSQPDTLYSKSRPPMRRNAWFQSDENFTTLHFHQSDLIATHFCLSSTRHATAGHLTPEAIISQAFNSSESLDHLLLLPEDRIHVHIDCEKKIATLTCERTWQGQGMVTITNKIIPLSKKVQQFFGEKHFYFLFQRIDRVEGYDGLPHEIDLMKSKAKREQIVSRWIWKDSPWLRVNVNDIPLIERRRGYPSIVRYCNNHDLWRRRQGDCEGKKKKLLWYPVTRCDFSSKYEAAAHHIHYNRYDDLIPLLTDDTEDLVHQVHPSEVCLPSLASLSPLVSSHYSVVWRNSPGDRCGRWSDGNRKVASRVWC
jgi:hypothetical protein